MMTITHDPDIITPNAADAALARKTSHILAKYLSKSNGSPVEFQICETGEAVDFPEPSMRMLLQILTEMGQGRSVVFNPHDTEVSIHIAAEILNVSSEFVVNLIQDGTIRRHSSTDDLSLKLGDVLAYQSTRKVEQRKGMEELVALSEEMGLYDDALK
jgi:hypothetical protein